MTKKPMDRFLTIRVTQAFHKRFHSKAANFGRPSDVLREIVEAFLEDRLVIQPGTKRNLYHVTRSQDQ